MGLELIDTSVVTAFLQVVMIDLVLAGDNAIVIGIAAAGLPKDQRNKVIFIGILAATVLRIVLALLTVQLLQIIGLLFAGGILLLWVCWKLWRELRYGESEDLEALEGQNGTDEAGQPKKTFKEAVWQIIVADLSMSLDNVLAVGGAAREHPMVLIFGLALSIALMGLAASLIARLLQKYRWIAYVGLVSILYVALQMIWRGWNEMEPYAEEGMRSLMVLTGGSAIGLATLLASVIGIVSFAVIRQRRRRKSAAAKTGHGDG